MLTEPNLRWKMRVQLTNAVGLDEAGVDGGGDNDCAGVVDGGDGTGVDWRWWSWS